jgi:guanylate kinase
MKKIVIIGKSCSGKTELAMSLKKKGYRVAITCTSRPMRPGEIDGVHYHFLEKAEFKTMIKDDKFIEHDEFNDWYYGLLKTEWETSDVFILTPRGLKQLIKLFGRPMMNVVFMDTKEEIRIRRSAQRSDDEQEVKRRLKTDDIDFARFIESEDWDLRLDIRIDDKFALISDLFSAKRELNLQHSI